MAEVLACVPVHGLDVVIAAVNRCLESGHTSLEQVRHLLTRLPENHEPEPATISTPDALKLNEVPIADTGRYDLLSENFSPIRLAEESEDA